MQGQQYNPMVMSQPGMNSNVGNMGMPGMHGMNNLPMSATPDPANININGMNNNFAAQHAAQPHAPAQGVPGLSDDSSQLALGMMQHVQQQQPNQNQGQFGAPQQPASTPNLHQGMDPNFFAAQQQMHQSQLGHLPQRGATPTNGPQPPGLGDFGGHDMDLETRKRKVEEEDEMKRTRQKTGKISCWIPTKVHVPKSSCLVGEPPDVPVRYVLPFSFMIKNKLSLTPTNSSPQ